MILHRLLGSHVRYGSSIITTRTSTPPDELYPNGLHRDRILPAIELLNGRPRGHQRRQRHRLPAPHAEHVDIYHCPLGPGCRREMKQAFEELAEAHDEDPLLHIEAREIRAPPCPAAWSGSTFRDLCGGPRSQSDYLEIA